MASRGRAPSRHRERHSGGAGDWDQESMASRNRDDPSSRGAARSLRRAATWRSQAYDGRAFLGGAA
ncbi:MAG TPA: hypothetical protein PK395_13255, partial [bacterium]|nr:hypothetical protein [bacterium]